MLLDDSKILRQVGDFRLEEFEISEADARFHNLRCAIHGDRYGTVLPGTYRRLMQNGTIWMTDTPMERRTNMEFVWNAKGDVLVFGMGIGVVVKMLKEMGRWESIDSLTVVELNPQVIEIMTPEYDDPKITVVQGDAFVWEPPKGRQYDTVYFDIWPDICGDNVEEMKILAKRAKKWVRGNWWMGFWSLDQIRAHFTSVRWKAPKPKKVKA